MAGERILVVDDGADMREFVVEYVLEPNGFQWLVAEDGQRGFKLAAAEQPDLILLDLQMPRMDGTSMLRSMKEHGLNIPVVLMTFHGSEQIAVEVFRMGVVDYVIKPFNVDEMLAAIDRALTETRLRAERDELTERLVASNLDLKRRIKELQALYGIGRSVAAQVDLDTLMSRVADAASYVTSADETTIMLLDNGGELNKRMLKQGNDPAIPDSTPTSDQNAYATMRSGRMLIVDGESSGQPGVSVLYAPTLFGNTPVGVLRVLTRVALGDHQTQLLNALADFVAVGVKIS